jgi:hypothetical protein
MTEVCDVVLQWALMEMEMEMSLVVQVLLVPVVRH